MHIVNTEIDTMSVDAGTMDAIESELKKTEAKVRGTFHAKNLTTEQSRVLAGSVALEGKTKTDVDSVVLGKLQTDGPFNGSVCDSTGKVIGAVREDPKYGKLVYASNGVLVGKLGINKEVQAFSIIDSEGDFKIQGDVEGTSASFAGKNMEIDAAMTGKGRFNLYAKEQMTAKEGAGINIQALEMRAHGFDNSSKIHTTDGYELEADRFYNWWKGTFDLQGGSLFDVKQITMNSGRLNGDNMTVNTGVFANLLGWSHVNRLTINAGVFANVAGDIAGYDSLTVNAGLSLNVGLMRSLHTRTSSLVAYNTGLYLPTLPSSLSECFSWDTLFGAVKTLVHNVSPTMGSALGTAKGAYGLARSGTALYKNLRKVGKQAVNNPGSVNIGEIVGMLVGAKDLFDGANGVLGSAQKTLKPAETATGEPDASVGTLQVLSQVGMDAARQTFAPTYSSQSVYSSNSGVVASYSISERMVSGKNTGVETAVHTDIHASSYVNRGQHLTTDFRGEITHTENFGEINSVTFKLKGESYSESGSTTAQVADVELDKWQQAGGVTSFESGRMNLNHLSASSGELHLTHTQLDVKKMTQIEKEAEINVAASVVNLHQTTIDGTLTATAGTRVTVADLKNDGQKMDVLRDGSELSVGQTGSIIIEEKSALLAGKTKSDGVVSILDSVAKVVDYSASATSATTVTGTREAAAGLFSEQRIEVHGDINTSHALIEAADRVSLADDATGKIADTTARSNEVMIAAQVEIQGHNLLASKKRLDVTATSQITGEGTMSFKAPAGSLMGAFSASGAVVEIDQLEESAKDLVYGRRTYVSFQPTESLSVKTSKTMTIDQAWNRSCQVELTAAGINVDAQVDMSSGLRLETTRDSLRITADMHSRKNMELKSARDILNTGAKVIADEDLFLETVQGDLRNVGGTIQGRHYFQGIINGDVYNEAVKIKSKGKHDTLHHYTPAELLGGQREDNEVGLFIEATGRMVNDASRIQSQGHNVVHAKKGFKGRAHTHSYVAEKHKRKGWWSGEERELKSTDVFVSSMTSTHGRNFVEVEEGGIRSAASSFISKEGTDLLARDNIDLLGVPAQQQVKEKKYSWFGISKKDTSAKHDSLTPTLLFDLGRSNIHSYEGDVNAIDARMLGPGNLLMKGKNVRVATRVENHSVDAHTRSLRFDFFGLAAMNAVASGQNFVSSLLHLDPTLGKVDDFFRSSNNPAEIAAGASNVALSAYNSYQQFNPSGFNPTISVGLSDYTTHQHYQTLGPGVIQRGSLEVEAEHVFSIKDAAVDVSGDMSVKAKVFSQQGSGLESDVTSETKSISLGVTAKGGVASVSVGYQSQEGKQVAQHSQELNVGGTLTVNTASWEQDQASASVGSLVGHVDELKVVSRQSTQEETHMSGSASTTGFFSVSVSVSKSAKTTEKSGVIVRNASGSDFTVGHADLTGGTIHTDDTQGVRIERMTSHDVCDREQSYHYGLSGNVRDFIPQQSSDLAPTTETVPAVIPSVGVDFDHRDYQAIHHAGVNPTIETTVLNDGDLNLHLDVPIIYPIKKLEEDMTPPILIPAQDIAEDLKSAAEVLSPAELDSSVNESPGSSRGSIAEENPVVLPSISRISQDDNISTSEPVFELKRKIDDGFRHTISAAEPSHEGAEFEHQEESSIPKRPDIKMKTKDVKMGSKKGGGNKGQIYELKTGQYINSDGVDQRLTEKNAKRDRVTKESKIEYKKELFTGTPKIYWQTEEQLGDEINIIRPTYFNDGGRVFFVAELDTKKNEVKIKLEAGGDIRFNIAHGHNDWMDLVKTEYAVDAASVQSLLRLSASNERQLTVEVVCEAGALGPNGSCSVKTAQISLFGLTCQVEGSLKTGVGVKVAGGAGLTVDKTQLQFRPYVKAGAFLGPGVEVTCKLSLGIDTDLPERMHKEVDRRIQTTATRTYLDQLTSLIETTTASNPSTFFGRVWKTYQIQCWEESRHECLTQVGNDAFVSTIFNVTP
ncbi:MAG: hypothetical protein NTW94_08995 [Legionellales bacterium]|nr:hypothetical protein [Legionellales bacterium]